MRLLALICLGVLLTACTRPSMQPESRDALWENRLEALAGLEDWRLDGRIGVVTPDDGFTATMRWEQDGSAVDLRLHGPFGAGGVHFNGNDEWLVVRDSEGGTFRTEQPQAELSWRLGWTLPLSSFRYWMAGRPDPRGEHEFELDSQGRITRLEQFGWTIVYRRYASAGSVDVPTRVTADNGEVTIKFGVRDWTFDPPSHPADYRKRVSAE